VASKGWEQKHVYAHRMRGEVRSVRIGEPAAAAAYFKNGSYLRTFAYVETTEPLSVYKIDHRRSRGGYIPVQPLSTFKFANEIRSPMQSFIS
jgi:hypothetical protein